MDMDTCIPLAILSLLVICASPVRARSQMEEEKHLEKQLSLLNKPSIKSFETDYGIIECINKYKQRAFDNPILKDHKIQMQPSSFSNGQNQGILKFGKFMHQNESGIDCPEGTIPIRKTTKEDLIRWNSALAQPQNFGPFYPINQKNNYAIVRFKKDSKPYTLAQGALGSHKPNVRTMSISGVQLWMYGGDEHGTNYVSAGWMVDPVLYGDYLPHITIYWKGDGAAGCPNMECSGFVQTLKEFPLGAPIKEYSGPEQLLSHYFQISRDEKTGHWWLAVQSGASTIFKPVGYWPKKLFSKLGEGASGIAYGGITRAPMPKKVVPPMGTGVVDCDVTNSGFITYIKYKLGSDKMIDIPSWSHTETQVDCPSVYKVDDCGQEKYVYFTFMYGGPGGSVC